MSGELTIADVHPEDSGFYICQAISVAGSVLTKAMLEVEEGETSVLPVRFKTGGREILCSVLSARRRRSRFYLHVLFYT